MHFWYAWFAHKCHPYNNFHFTTCVSISDVNRYFRSYSSFIVMEFSSSVVSPSFNHTISSVVIPLPAFTVTLSSDDALRDMLESEMTTTPGISLRPVQIQSPYLRFVLHLESHKQLTEGPCLRFIASGSRRSFFAAKCSNQSASDDYRFLISD